MSNITEQAVLDSLKQIIDPDLVLFAEKDGQPVGFALAVPDINQAFLMGKKIPPGAKNLPTAIMNLMTNRKKIDARPPPPGSIRDSRARRATL